MRVRLLSRASDLAVLQAGLVANALMAAAPELGIERVTRHSSGDRDRRIDLWKATEKGLFTADLSQSIAEGDADIAVHSWKDLPIENFRGNRIVGTLERADPRDVLLVRKDAAAAHPTHLRILSSSPRRTWQLQTSLRRLLPWRADTLEIQPVRGNIPTRIKKLLAGEADALVVAKAALDRLLSAEAPDEVALAIRRGIDACRWMVLPLKEFPAAPAQGALAIEVASGRNDLRDLVEQVTHAPTTRAVEREREILGSFGGGCSLAVGATILPREYGDVTSVRAHVPSGTDQITWALETRLPRAPEAATGRIWPRPDERDRAVRRPLHVTPPADSRDLWIARADAVPVHWTPPDTSVVWAAGSRTWSRLADRGIWVNGCADGLGDTEPANVDALTGRAPHWRRLTHTNSDDGDAFATYEVDQTLPDDLDQRTHFFWTSGSLFREAVRRFPSLKDKWHASGPGRTSRVIRETLGAGPHATIWLEYEQWLQSMTS